MTREEFLREHPETAPALDELLARHWYQAIEELVRMPRGQSTAALVQRWLSRAYNLAPLVIPESDIYTRNERVM